MAKYRGFPYSENRVIHCDDTGETVPGNKYLSSKHWKQMRISVYNHYKGVCQRCGSNVPLEEADIHHRVYKRIGSEKITDLVLYCSHCHACVHKTKKQFHAANKNIQDLIQKLTSNERIEAYDVLVNHFDFDDREFELGDVQNSSLTIDKKISDLNYKIRKLKTEVRKLKREKERIDTETNNEK